MQQLFGHDFLVSQPWQSSVDDLSSSALVVAAKVFDLVLDLENGLEAGCKYVSSSFGE